LEIILEEFLLGGAVVDMETANTNETKNSGEYGWLRMENCRFCLPTWPHNHTKQWT